MYISDKNNRVMPTLLARMVELKLLNIAGAHVTLQTPARRECRTDLEDLRVVWILLEDLTQLDEQRRKDESAVELVVRHDDVTFVETPAASVTSVHSSTKITQIC